MASTRDSEFEIVEVPDRSSGNEVVLHQHFQMMLEIEYLKLLAVVVQRRFERMDAHVGPVRTPTETSACRAGAPVAIDETLQIAELALVPADILVIADQRPDETLSGRSSPDPYHNHRLARRIGILNEPLETAQKSRQIGVYFFFCTSVHCRLSVRACYLVTRVPSDDTGMIVIALIISPICDRLLRSICCT